MFEQSLVVKSTEMRRRKRWATALSLVVETTVIGAALMIPMFTTQALPPAPSLADIIHAPMGRPKPPHVDVFTEQHPQQVRQHLGNQLMQPDHIPTNIDRTAENRPPEEPVEVADNRPYIPGLPPGDPPRDPNAVDKFLPKDPVLPQEQKPTVYRPSTSSVMEGYLMRRVTPVYPQIARQIRLEGTVVLQAVISREGRIEQLQAVSGHALLIPAAVAAVQQWLYRPYLLNGNPVEVHTEIRVNFIMN